MNDKEANVGGSNPEDDQSLSEDAFAALLAGEVQETEESPEDAEETESEAEETEEVEETDEETEDEEGEPEATEGLTADSILKQLEGLDPEEIKKLGKELGTKALSRFGELTWRAKAAEEEAQRIKAQQGQQQPAADSEPVTSRFLEGVETTDQLATKVKELKALGKDIERILDDHDDYGPNDPIEVGEQTFTKKRLKALRSEVTEALTEAVPSKQAQFAKEAEISALTEKSEANARAQVPELEDENSEVAKNFKTLTESPVFKKIAQLVPDARPVLPMLAAHAVRSIYGKQAKASAKPATTGTTLKAKPPASPALVAAAPVKAGNGKKREAEKAAADFEKSGSVDSFARFLEARGG